MMEKLSVLQSVSSKAIAILDDLLLCQQLESNSLEMELEELNPFIAMKSALRDLRNKISVEPFEGDRMLAKRLVLNCDESKLRIAFNKLFQVTQNENEKEPFKLQFSFKMDPSRNGYSLLHSQYQSTKVHPIASTGVFSIDIVHFNSNQPEIFQAIENIAAKRLIFEREAEFEDRVSSMNAWIAHNLIDRHSGSITATRDNSGMEFRISFPVYVLEEMNPVKSAAVDSRQLQWEIWDDAPNNRRSTLENTGNINDVPLSVLVVDDSKMVRKVMGNLMNSLGHAFQEACDGAEAVDMVRQSISQSAPFDVILMDNQMPNMMGHEATKILRAELRYSGMILGVTGNALAEDIRSFISYGANTVILKPLTAEKFIQARYHFIKNSMVPNEMKR